LKKVYNIIETWEKKKKIVYICIKRVISFIKVSIYNIQGGGGGGGGGKEKVIIV
jgi:hypothetical protein